MTSLIPSTSTPTHLADHEDDDHAEQRGYIKGTDYSLPYFSQFSRLHDIEASQGLLRHVNCGYLSTHGMPPTLLALKQHAQSLCALIHLLNPTVYSGQIGVGGLSGENKKKQKSKKTNDPQTSLEYQLNDAFDFLTDLSVPYTNDDPDHHKTLGALVNEVRSRNEALRETTYHCPFAETTTTVVPGPDQYGEDGGDKKEKHRPYASHHNLIMHANACLERLDHEFSATGGLMSLLPYPPDGGPQSDIDTNPLNTNLNNAIHHTRHRTADAEAQHAAAVARNHELANARNSLLGQWLHFTQSLVARMHELERAYADALDALAGEAAVPVQVKMQCGNNGGGGGGGREIAYPQDRWVLVNAGDEAFDLVHELLDRKQAETQAKEGVWRENGVIGDVLWEGQGGDTNAQGHARGIISIDLTTRYYRLTTPPSNPSNPNNPQQTQPPKSTLFLLPAYSHHPSVTYTRTHLSSSQNPTVITPPLPPRIPTHRATDLEKRYTAQTQHSRRTERLNTHLLDELERAAEGMGVLQAEMEGLASGRDGLLFAFAEGVDDDDEQGEGEKGGKGLVGRLQEQRERAGRAEREVLELRREVEVLRGLVGR